MSTLTATQPTEETTEYIKKKVSVITPEEAPNIYSAQTVDPECITMTGTVTDVDAVFPADDIIHTDRTVTSDTTMTGDEPTTEFEFR